MSIHPSLKLHKGQAETRSVLKRTERIRMLMAEGKWDRNSSSIYGLPKVKIVKIKIKKEKAQEKPAEGSTTETKTENKS